MTKVFIGGSRHVSGLPASVRERIDRIIEKELPVIVGDANGADKAVQSYLNKCGYRNVEVFCSGRSARNNIGSWELRHVEADSPRGTLDFYTAKDRVMTEAATHGLMIWDGKSTGTLLNILRLLNQNKKVVLYVGPAKQFRELKHADQWQEFISAFPWELRSTVEKRAASERQGIQLGAGTKRAGSPLPSQHP